MANMRKIISPTSSETSETQSVDDNHLGSGNQTPPTANSNTNSAKNWKRMKDSGNETKDGDSKRPPWRAVSVSTLPKPDKNALLRAKLLDASRRLRSGKSSVAVQTDLEPTKLMKDVALSTQTDLVLYRESAMMTDGSYMKCKQGTDEFILTYSVSQMTDRAAVQEIATQTLLPKLSGDDFISAYNDKNFDLNSSEGEFSDIERELLLQIRKIREVNKQFSYEEDEPKKVADTAKAKFWQPTISSWCFEYDRELCSNFNSRLLYNVGKGQGTMPFPLAIASNYNPVDLNAFFMAIDELILQSNALVNVIENMQLRARARDKPMREESRLNLHLNLPSPELTLTSDHWNEVIKQEEAKLEEILKKAKPRLLTRKK